MNTNVKAPHPRRRFRLARTGAAAVLASLAAASVGQAQTTYTYYIGTSNAYLSASHWTVGGTASTKFPGVDNNASSTADGATNDIAAIGAIGFTAANGFGINFNTSANNGVSNNTGANGALALGAFDFLSGLGANLQIGNSSTTLAGVLTLNGVTLNSVANTIIANEGTNNVNFAPQVSGTATTTPMTIALGNATNNVLQVNSSGNIVITTVVQNGAGTKLSVTGAGSGRVDLLNTANTFTGGLTVNGAEVRIAADGSLGTGTAAVTVDGGRLGMVSGTAVTINAARDILLGSTAGTSVSAVGAGSVLTYNGVFKDLSTAGILVKQGAGTLAVGGVSTYTGDTSINNGFLQLTTGNNRLPTGTTVNIGQAASNNLGTFDLNGFNQQVAGLNSTAGTNATATKNTVTTATAATLTLGGSGTYAYGAGTPANSGVITGVISIVKTGSGTQTFGDANTYTGTTAVTGGTLLVNGTNSGTGAVTVNNTGSLLGGTGTIAGATTVNAGANITGATNGTVGTLTLQSGLTFTGTAGSLASYLVDLSGATSDRLTITGALNLSGAFDRIAFNGTADGTSTYALASYTGGVTGTFDTVANLPAGYGLVYNAGELDLVPVPEPGTVAAGLLALGTLGYSQRRRVRGFLAARRRRAAALSVAA